MEFSRFCNVQLNQNFRAGKQQRQLSQVLPFYNENVGSGGRRGSTTSTPPVRGSDVIRTAARVLVQGSRILFFCGILVFFGCTGSSLQCVGSPVVEFSLPLGMWDLNSPSGDQTCVPFIGRWTLNHKTSWEVPPATFLIGH